MDLIVRHPGAEHAPRRSRALLDGVLPVLYAHLPTEYRVIVIGDVTRGVNADDDKVTVETEARLGDDARDTPGALEGGNGVLEDGPNIAVVMSSAVMPVPSP